MDYATSSQILGFFIWLFFIVAGFSTLTFIVMMIPFWITMATIEKFSPRLADRISTFILEF